MANKSMTKSEIATHLAEKVGISKKQATLFLLAQAELAHKQAKNVFTLPGIGKLKLVDRPARKMIMPFGPM
jgi:DNA-binding protein HU-beta